MADVDLAAIRADHAVAAEERIPSAWTYEDRLAAEVAIGRCVDDHLPALLALVDEQAARIAEFEAGLPKIAAELAETQQSLEHTKVLVDKTRALVDAANARTAERCRELMAARRTVEQLEAERDHWQNVATGGGDCPVDGCPGELLRLVSFGGDEFVRLSCGHAPEATARTDEAATTDEFRVEFRLDRGPADRWHRSATRYPDLNAAMDRVRDSQKRYPEPVFRIWRVAKSEAVVWQSPVPVPPSVWAVVDEVHVTSDAQLAEVVERANGEKPPESPQERSAHPETRETGGSAA